MAGLSGLGSCAVPMATSLEKWTVMDHMKLGCLRSETGQGTVNVAAALCCPFPLFNLQLSKFP